MRRKDREITGKSEIIEVLKSCDTVRIAMNGGKYPYIVPVSFGLDDAGDMPVVYFHCAKEGMKLDLLQADGSVCLEGDIFLGIEKTKGGITTRYKSVICFGRCIFVKDEAERVRGTKLILAHYGYSDYPPDHCGGFAHMEVGKIELKRIYGKQNLPSRP